jgi:acetylornithine deacetylase/succinyl-diaminopimelate desuccinylase-like protein
MRRACDAVGRICAEPSVRSAADGTPARLELRERDSYPPWPANSGSDALAGRYVKLAAKQGITARPVARGGGSDVSHAADLTPALDGLGILGGGLHSKSEWADAATLPVRARIAADLIAELCVPPVTPTGCA